MVDVLVVHSEDGGRTFSDPILADDVDRLFLVLAVDGERVAIAVGGGSYAADNSILLLVAPTAAPVFETQVLDEAFYDPLAPNGTITLVDQPELCPVACLVAAALLANGARVSGASHRAAELTPRTALA